MLKWILKGLMVAVLALVMISCSEDSTGPGDGGDNTPKPSAGKITMSVGGQPWESFTAAADTSMFNGAIASIGVAGARISPVIDGLVFAVFNINGIAAGNTYSYSPTDSIVIMSAGYDNNANSSDDALFDPTQSTGTIAITDLNLTANHVSGTFSFNLYRQTGNTLVEVRNGTFTQIPLN